MLLTGAVTVGAASAHAGPFDAVRSKVSSVRSAPAPVKAAAQPLRDRADELLQRAAETQSTINAVIAETDVIKSRLEPVGEAFETVRSMKQRFEALQFNPAELLDGPELQDALAVLRERREAMQERLNDPHLETFRSDLLTTLGDLRGLVAEDIGLGARERSPVETLVENAPATVMALIKAAAGTGFERLQTGTRELAGDVGELRSMNVLDDFDSEVDLCLVYGFGAEAIYFKALRTKKRIIKVSNALKLIANRIPSTPMRFGVHGYAELVQIDMGETTKDKLGTLLIAIEGLGARVDLVRETVSHYSAPGACGA